MKLGYKEVGGVVADGTDHPGKALCASCATKVFKLTPLKLDSELWRYCSRTDKAIIVRAEDEGMARQMAEDRYGKSCVVIAPREIVRVWMCPKNVECRQIDSGKYGATGDPGVLDAI